MATSGPTHVGLARGYSANGDLKQALEHARKALAQAPDSLNRQSPGSDGRRVGGGAAGGSVGSRAQRRGLGSVD